MGSRGAGSDRPRETITAFNICIIEDPEFGSGPLGLFVHNIADADMNKNGILHHDGLPAVKKAGKPSKWGFAGGGLKEDYLEKPPDAARTEFKDETGINPKETTPIFDEPFFKQIRTDMRTGEMKGPFKLYERGQWPSVTLGYREEAISNPVYIFRTTIDWPGCKLRKLMLDKKNIWSAPGAQKPADFDPTSIPQFGMCLWFEDLPPEELTSLDILETNEIDGIGLFPIGMLLTERPSNFYKTHIDWLGMAVEKMGIADKCQYAAV